MSGGGLWWCKFGALSVIEWWWWGGGSCEGCKSGVVGGAFAFITRKQNCEGKPVLRN